MMVLNGLWNIGWVNLHRRAFRSKKLFEQVSFSLNNSLEMSLCLNLIGIEILLFKPQISIKFQVFAFDSILVTNIFNFNPSLRCETSQGMSDL